VDSTRLSAQATPDEVVALLNEMYSEFDDLAAKHGVEKVKTIGDTYMAAAGLTGSSDDPAKMIEFALDLQDTARAKTWPNGEPVRFRVGIHTGPVVAGVIGHERLIYDVWGDAVNMAARMESTGPVDGIQITGEVKSLLGDRYQFEKRNAFQIKGKGLTVTYTLETVSKAASSGPEEPAAVTAH
jgi:class 3 adenylate cyclase